MSKWSRAQGLVPAFFICSYNNYFVGGKYVKRASSHRFVRTFFRETASQFDGRGARGCGTRLGLAHGALRCHKIYGTPPRCALVWYLVDYLALTAADELCSHCLPSYTMLRRRIQALFCFRASKDVFPPLRCKAAVQMAIVGMLKLYAKV